MDIQVPESRWRTSLQCSSGGCVQVAKVDETYLFRDSKDPEGPRLQFNADEWIAFKAGVLAGDFD